MGDAAGRRIEEVTKAMSGFALGVVAFGLLVATTVLWFRKARAVELVGSRAGYVAGWAGAAGLGAAALASSPGWVGGLLGGVGLVGGAFLVTLVAVSRQQVAPDVVRVGQRLPEFTALDDDARPFTLSGIEGRPILLKFFRGHW